MQWRTDFARIDQFAPSIWFHTNRCYPVSRNQIAPQNRYSVEERKVPMTDKNKQKERTQREIDEELDDSFPASDPPSWTPGTTKESDEDAKLKRIKDKKS